MYTSKKIIFLIAVIFSAQFVTAQPWLQSIKKPNPTFAETKAAAAIYFKQHPPTEGEDDIYAQYKRWEWWNEARLLPDGNYPNADVNSEERSKYFASLKKNKALFGAITTFGAPTFTGNWVNNGPTNDNGDTYTGVGRVNCIAFHPTNANIFWVGTPSGGLWKTTDGGNTWATNTDTTLPFLGITSIIIDPTNENTIYLATGDGDGGDTYSVGVLKSTDGGISWNKTGLSWTQNDLRKIHKLIINPQNPNTLIAATSVGVYKTINGGANWTHISSSLNINGYDVAYNPTDTTIVYVCGTSKIYRSVNGGSSFTSVASITNSERITLAVSPNNPTLVEAIVGSSSQNNLLGIWRSTDKGLTYNQYFNGTPPNNLLGYNPDGSDDGGQAWYTLPFMINPNNYKEKWVGGVNTWHTIDDGVTWNASSVWVGGNGYTTTAQVVHADKHFYAYNPLLTNTVFDCNDGGLAKTSDSGKTWIDLSKGLVNSQIYKIAVAQTVSNLVECGLQDNGSKEFDLNSWKQFMGGDGAACIIDYSDTTYKYSSNAGGTLYAYRKNKYYRTISDSIPFDSIEKQAGGAWVTPFVIDPQKPTTLYAGYEKIYKTINRGTTWSAISPTLTSNNLYFIAVAPSNPKFIWASSNDTLYYTTNGGTTWATISRSLIDANIGSTNISGIAINSTNPNIVWVTFSGYSTGKKVYKTINGGASWINMSGTLPNIPVNCILCQKGAADTCYIGTDIGVYYKDSSLSDWIFFSNGLPNVIVNDLAISYLNQKLWAGTFGRGLWNSDTYSKALPVDFISIDAEKKGENVCINWQTATELNTSHFILQHSKEGFLFGDIGTVKAIGSGANSYQFTDSKPSYGINYYRLQSVDKDGSNSYSRVVSVNIGDKQTISIVPNPARDFVTIRFSEPVYKGTIEVYDIKGKAVITQSLNGSANSYKLNTQNLTNGIYVIKVNSALSNFSEKLVISK